MTVLSSRAPSAQHDFYDLARQHDLARTPSPKAATSIIAKLSAAGLVIASAGLGCVYAYGAGSHHALTLFDVPVLAVLAVLMALSLEVAKPFAIASALSAFRDWKPVQGALLAVLGLIAVAYSLTAELSLMATLRSDTVATRQAAIKATASDEAANKRHAERYDAAKRELASLAPARAAGELQADLDGLLQTPGVNNCAAIDGPVTRKVCPKVTAAKAELARAQRRGELEAIMGLAVNPPAAAAEPTEALTVADPGAAALSTYLAALGIAVKPDTVSQWLVLVPVIALEFGSALAGILAGLVNGGTGNASKTAPSHARQVPCIDVCTVAAPTVTAESDLHNGVHTACTTENASVCGLDGREPGNGPHTCSIIPLAPVRAGGRDEAARRVLATLNAQGGIVNGSLRTLASELAVTVGTLRAAIAALALSGEIVSEPSAKGTSLRLAA